MIVNYCTKVEGQILRKPIKKVNFPTSVHAGHRIIFHSHFALNILLNGSYITGLQSSILRIHEKN